LEVSYNDIDSVQQVGRIVQVIPLSLNEECHLNKLGETIMEQLKTQITNVFDKKAEEVFHSTGSMHTKEDVLKIINLLQEECLKAINDFKIPESNNGYSEEEIENAFKNLDFSNYASVDKESAEFYIGYSNQLELDSVDFEWEEDSLYDDLISELKKLSNQEDENQEVTIIED
jgi:hypothetical protein